MKVHVANHPLIAHKLTVLRDKTTNSPTFRGLVEELVMLLAYEATRDVKTVPKTVETPVAPYKCEVQDVIAHDVGFSGCAVNGLYEGPNS